MQSAMKKPQKNTSKTGTTTAAKSEKEK